MLKKISLKNFKAFESLDELDVRNLTVVVGKNSCGKSSIMQSLLLLKQTLEGENDVPLCMEGKYLKFSSLKEISYGLPAVNHASIGYDLSLSDLEDESINGKVLLEFKNKKINDIYAPALTKFSVTKNDEAIMLNKLTKNRVRNAYEKFIQHFELEKGDFLNHKQLFHKFLPEMVELNFRGEESNKKNIIRSIKLPLFTGFPEQVEIISLLNKTIKNIKYLSPVRANPERAYVHYSQDVSQLSYDGSNAAHIFFSKRHDKVLWKGSELTLEEAVNKCVEQVGLSQQLTPSKIGDILYQVGIKVNGSNSNVSLADVGFGYSQVLPIILLGLLNSQNNLMLIEQPEIHLHPSSAGNLADLFLGFAQDNKHFIIETHSQEFINKLRLRVIQNPDLKKKINVVFVEQNGSSSKIKQFEIDENGMFPEWPNGFIDESENLAKQILHARLGIS